MSTLLRKFSKRRRPVLSKAELVKNPIFAEDEDYTLSEADTFSFTFRTLSKPKISLMQKFSNWVSGHLGSRNKRRESRRADSEVRPQIVVAPQTYMDQYNKQPYEIKRRNVCTNPWFYAPDCVRPIMGTSISTNRDLLNASYSSTLSQLRDESLRVNTLAGSACSSGYGSNDSSPECSVHQPSWQPSSQIEKRGELVDKAVECHSLDLDDALGTPSMDEDNYNHIYYELEPSLTQLKECVGYADDSCYSGSVELNTGMSASSSRSDSPIYAIPCSSSAGESRCGSIEYVDDSDGYAELSRRCQPEPPNKQPQLIEHTSNGYARLQRSIDRPSAFTRCVPRLPSPKFFAPPPPSEFPRNCLDLLDEQIAELKMKTQVVSRLVETAKERRELRDYARNLCMEHIKDLRNLRLYVERGFELHI